MHKPLVTVICLSYNHDKFITEAVESVIHQSYDNLQIIIVDDASQDGSQTVINHLKEKYLSIEVLLLQQNVGNCAAFNQGYALAKGDFIIDFATDDVMMRDRIEKQITAFEKHGHEVGVLFTDATYIDEQGRFLRNHFEHLLKQNLIAEIPHGHVYRQVLERYFIPSPTALIRREVIDQLGGYDETLSYEDFDLFVRASRLFKFEYLDEKLTAIRKLSGSMSSGWYVPGDRQLLSTYHVCVKAVKLNRDQGDQIALTHRVRYELRQSVMSENHQEAILFFNLLESLKGVRTIDQITTLINKLRLPLRHLRNAYHKIRFGS